MTGPLPSLDAGEPREPVDGALDGVTDAVTAGARAGRKRENRILIGAVATAVLVALASIVISLSGSSRIGSEVAADVATEVSRVAATGEVAAARADSLAKERRDLDEVNAAMQAAGLAPCPDPGDAATAYQVSTAVGECRGTLRTLGELQKRGVPIPGVSAPDPAGSRFPAR